ncbi:hypothetical protein [Arcobacter sp. AHV-9/2010]|uniref:hypothetical protein n=1 Tax=Arcobacter sp. AHV-9/2010 TaxID=2021861 RepID=UPI002159EBA1|nr:hypothetical protein [Arcobacter sp. CECT 9299]
MKELVLMLNKYNKKILNVLYFNMVIFLLSGCATIFDDNYQTIKIDSDKSYKGKWFVVDKSFSSREFTSPTVLYVKRSNKDIIISSDNNEFKTSVAKSTVNNWFWLNFAGFIYGSYSSTTDFASGAAWKYDDTVYISENYSK